MIYVDKTPKALLKTVRYRFETADEQRDIGINQGNRRHESKEPGRTPGELARRPWPMPHIISMVQRRRGSVGWFETGTSGNIHFSH